MQSKPLFNSHHDRINTNARSATGCTDGRLACSAFYIVFGLLTNRRCMSLDDCVSQEEEGEQGEGGRGGGGGGDASELAHTHTHTHTYTHTHTHTHTRARARARARRAHSALIGEGGGETTDL